MTSLSLADQLLPFPTGMARTKLCPSYTLFFLFLTVVKSAQRGFAIAPPALVPVLRVLAHRSN